MGLPVITVLSVSLTLGIPNFYFITISKDFLFPGGSWLPAFGCRRWITVHVTWECLSGAVLGDPGVQDIQARTLGYRRYRHVPWGTGHTGTYPGVQDTQARTLVLPILFLAYTQHSFRTYTSYRFKSIRHITNDNLYRVIQEERSVFWELIPSGIARKKFI
jgi:hypothetical protein